MERTLQGHIKHFTMVNLEGHLTWTLISRIKFISPSTQDDNELDNVSSYSCNQQKISNSSSNKEIRKNEGLFFFHLPSPHHSQVISIFYKVHNITLSYKTNLHAGFVAYGPYQALQDSLGGFLHHKVQISIVYINTQPIRYITPIPAHIGIFLLLKRMFLPGLR